MRKPRLNIVWISIILMALVTIGSWYAFRHLIDSMVFGQHQIFMTNAEAALKNINTRIQSLSNQLKSYTEIPAFGEIHYHTLTMNQSAVNQNRRSLELYFFSLHQRQPGFAAISFIDIHGREQIRISEGAISNVLRDLSNSEEFLSYLNNAKKTDLLHLNTNSIGPNQTINWWLPVLTSASKKQGYLKFDITIDLFKEIIELQSEDSELQIDLVNEQRESLLTGEPVSFVLADDNGWFLTNPLPLPGLTWEVYIQANRDLLLEQVYKVSNIGLYLIAPIMVFLLAALGILAIRHHRAEKNIHHMAFHDMLTGLINRHEFEWQLDNAIESAQQNDFLHAVLYMDLDHFKLVNDTAGHVAGDELLRQLSTQLEKHIRETDKLARLGGDEFALLVEHCSPESAETIANNIVKMMQEYKFSWDGKTYDIGISIGLVSFDKNTKDHDEVLRYADLACYRAKESGRNRVKIYNPDDGSMQQHHGEMESVNRIRHALREDNFELHAQIIESLQENDDMQSWEMLIRLRENNELIAPASFIPAAERFGLMPEIDRWVIRHALAQYDRLNSASANGKKFRFFINISGTSLSDDSFFDFVRSELKKWHIPDGGICFEITETAAIINLNEVVEFVEEIQGEGCNFALDDFGAGLSSFSYLKMIPVDFLKIDGSFVQGMLQDKMSYSIVDVINQIGHTMEIRTIAEFVSDQQLKAELKEIGIDYAQGFGIHSPQPLLDLINNELAVHH